MIWHASCCVYPGPPLTVSSSVQTNTRTSRQRDRHHWWLSSLYCNVYAIRSWWSLVIHRTLLAHNRTVSIPVDTDRQDTLLSAVRQIQRATVYVLVLCDTSILIVDTYVTIPVSLKSRYTAVYRSSKKYRETAQVSRVSTISRVL